MKAPLTIFRGEVPWGIIVEHDKRLRKMPEFMKKSLGIVAKRIVPQPKLKVMYNFEAAMKIKESVKIPVIVVEGITKLEEIEDIIN